MTIDLHSDTLRELICECSKAAQLIEAVHDVLSWNNGDSRHCQLLTNSLIQLQQVRGSMLQLILAKKEHAGAS